jgi:hypothetical protein
MRTLEARGKIRDIDEAIDTAKKIGGVFKGSYRATDIIFKSKKEDEKGVIDLRVFELNNRQTKNYKFIHKIAEWSDKTKKDRIILKSEFYTMGDALNFIIDHYDNNLVEHYKYSREGWEYHLEKGDIFIEYIEKFGSTMEIEADNKSDLEELFKLFEVEERFSESTPEIMRKLLGKE